MIRETLGGRWDKKETLERLGGVTDRDVIKERLRDT